MNYKYLKYLALASTLYILHIVLDIFTVPTPILWPAINQAYVLDIELSCIVTRDNIRIAPSIIASSENANFTRQPVVDDPIVSSVGLVTVAGIIAVLLAEHLMKVMKHENC